MTNTIDMQRICDLLNTQGITAYVEQTGGGTATIYAGESFTDKHGDPRHPVLAGPGWFDGPAWTQPHGDPTDFYIGPDDDGESDISEIEVAPTVTEEQAAERIADLIRKA